MAVDLNRLAGRWGFPAAIAVSVVWAVACQITYQSEPPEHHHAVWLWLAGVGSVSAAVLPFVDANMRRKRKASHEDRLSQAVREARLQAVLTINDALDPLVEALAQLMTASDEERDGLREKLITQALNSAAQVIGPERTRVNLFEVQGEEPHRTLRCATHSAGRAGGPTTVFEEGQQDGDFMFRLLAEDNTYFCPDVQSDPPPGWDASRHRDYRTFITVPARVGEQAAGFLTADSVAVGDLKEQDMSMLRVLGTIIAASVLTT